MTNLFTLTCSKRRKDWSWTCFLNRRTS